MMNIEGIAVCTSGHKSELDATGRAPRYCKECGAEYRRVNREKLLKLQRESYERNKDKTLARQKVYRETHRELEKARHATEKSRRKRLERSREVRREYKRKVLEHYGRSECKCCTETTTQFLSIDHIGNGGNKQLRDLGISSGVLFYKWLIENNLPSGYQVLCFNCNVGRHLNGGICPHIVDTRSNDASSQTKRFKIKSEIINHYGGKCACKHCGESIIDMLTIDHINNDGARHRKQIKVEIYTWLKKNDYPQGFQILCWNCNMGKQINGGICPHEDADSGEDS